MSWLEELSKNHIELMPWTRTNIVDEPADIYSYDFDIDDFEEIVVPVVKVFDSVSDSDTEEELDESAAPVDSSSSEDDIEVSPIAVTTPDITAISSTNDLHDKTITKNEARFVKIDFQLSNNSGNVANVVKTNEMLKNLVDELRSEVEALKTSLKDQAPCQLRPEIEKLKSSMKKNEKDLSQFMQYNRRENIEIVGIPQSVSDQDLEGVVVNILQRIGVTHLSYYDIAGCHRLKNRKTSSSNVIVRFVCRKMVGECFDNAKNIRKAIPEFPNLRIEENLCPRYTTLYEKCEELRKQNKIKLLWTYNGQIYFTKTNNKKERGKMILHESDLEYHFPRTI